MFVSRVFRGTRGLRAMSTYANVVVTAHGGADKLAYQPAALTRAGMEGEMAADEVLVEMKWAGVNFIDTYFRSGLYPNTPPFCLGQEGAGVVVAAGSGVDPSVVGKKVSFSGSKTGSYAGLVRLTQAQANLLPDSVDLKLAAAITLQGLTSHYLVHSTYEVKPGDWVLVHAAAGGCGLLISQMAKNRGATVIGTCGTAEKAQLAKDVGRCDHVINYADTEDFAGEVRKLVPEGVHVVYDGVGKATFEGSLKSLRRRGMLASFGNASGAVPPVAPLTLTKHGSVFLTRPTLVDYIADPEEKAARVKDIMTWVTDGTLTCTVGKIFPLAEARAAHEALEGRQTTGKVLLEI